MEIQLLRADNYISEQMDQFGNMVYRLSILYLRNEQDAQDAFQEVFLRLFEKAPKFENEAHAKAWLIKTTANYCKNVLRMAWRWRQAPLDELAAAPSNPDDRELLRQLLALPVKYRRTLYLHYYEGYTTDEIGQMLGEKPATVRTHLRRGRELLKADLLDDADHPAGKP